MDAGMWVWMLFTNVWFDLNRIGIRFRENRFIAISVRIVVCLL